MLGCGGDSSSDNIDANIESNDTYISTISAEVPQANIKRELDYPKYGLKNLIIHRSSSRNSIPLALAIFRVKIGRVTLHQRKVC